MKTATRPPAEAQAPAPEQQTTRSLGIGTWARGRSQVSVAHLQTWGLFGALAAIAFMVVSVYLRPPPKAPEVRIPEPTTAPEGFAESYIETWLVANPGDTLQPFFPFRVDFGRQGLGAPPPPPTVLSTASIDAVQLGADYWTVTVLARTRLGDGPVTNRYFRVPVARTTVRPPGVAAEAKDAAARSYKVYVAAMTPAEVSGPLGAKAPELAVESFTKPEANDPLAASVSQFLAALLTGKGELGRYTAPDSNVRPIVPSPFVAVEVTSLGARRFDSAQHLEVVATATGIDAAGHPTGLTYPLELVLREGRWEVVRVLYAPTLGAQPDLTPTPVAAPPTTVALPTTTSSTSTTRRTN